MAQQQAAMAHNVPRAIAHQHPHHPHHPQAAGPQVAQPRPGQRFALKVSDSNLYLHAAGGPREGHALVLNVRACVRLFCFVWFCLVLFCLVLFCFVVAGPLEYWYFNSVAGCSCAFVLFCFVLLWPIHWNIGISIMWLAVV